MPPEGAVTTDYDVLLLPGEVIEDYELSSNPFIVIDSNITGDYENNLTVTVKNNHSQGVTDIEVYILLYDPSGNIIGGGNDYIEETIQPAGTAAVEIPIYYPSTETIDTWDVWVVPGYWTEFE